MTTNRLAKVSPGTNPKEKSPLDPQECCDWANERLHPDAVAAGLSWYVTGNKDKPIELRQRAAVLTEQSPGLLPKKHIAERDRSKFTATDWAELNEHLERMESCVRYRPDGSRYMIERQA